MLICIVAGPSSLQVPTVIFQKKGNFMLWFWSRRRIRCMHRMRLIWGHLDLQVLICGLDCVFLFFFFLFLSYVWDTGRVLIFFMIFFVHFFYHAIVSVFKLLWYLNISPRSKFMVDQDVLFMYSQDKRVSKVIIKKINIKGGVLNSFKKKKRNQKEKQK